MKNEINIEKSESLNTSSEIIAAINEISSDGRTGMQIWESPTDSEFRNVVSRADELAGHTEGELLWGFSSITVHIDADPTDFGARYDF